MTYRIALAGVVLLTASVCPAAADFPDALVFDTGYATGPAAWIPWFNLPAIDDSLWIYGVVEDANAPFDALLPAGPYELTYVFDSYACTSATHAGDQTCSTAELAFFGVGSILVFLDQTPDADFANPETFRDGERVLVALANPLQLFTETHCVNGTRDVQRTFVNFTGGTWFEYVSRDGVGLLGRNDGEFRGDIPEAFMDLGYIAESTSTIYIFESTPVTPTTWGRVKALYR